MLLCEKIDVMFQLFGYNGKKKKNNNCALSSEQAPGNNNRKFLGVLTKKIYPPLSLFQHVRSSLMSLKIKFDS